ncbi:MAG: translation elongation factor Ts [Sphingomonadales bacterium]
MAEITAALVKELRTKSGAGMMDCKKALVECGGDLEAAVDWLRTKGLATAAKKAGRVAAEGLVAVAVNGGAGAIVEVNAETDFVARNEQFQAFVNTVAEVALAQGGELDTVVKTGYPDKDRTVEAELTDIIATIGENMNLRRCASLSVNPGVVASYIHNATAPGMGKIGVLVALKSDGDADRLLGLGKQIAMHIAAANPQSLSVEDLDPEIVEREREVLAQQARESGRPENIIEKMVEGRMRKFFEEAVLLNQTWVIDGESKVSQAVETVAKELGTSVELIGFVRYGLGEGIEREEGDFAAEVAAVAGNG